MCLKNAFIGKDNVKPVDVLCSLSLLFFRFFKRKWGRGLFLSVAKSDDGKSNFQLAKAAAIASCLADERSRFHNVQSAWINSYEVVKNSLETEEASELFAPFFPSLIAQARCRICPRCYCQEYFLPGLLS